MNERIFTRPVLRDPQPSVPSRVCEVTGCSNSTRDTKPWCPIHVEDHAPPAIRIRAEIAHRDAEIARIMEKGGDLDPKGFLAREALRRLHEQAFTSSGLSRAMGIPEKVAKAVLAHLVRAGVARQSVVRGKMAVSLNVRTVG